MPTVLPSYALLAGWGVIAAMGKRTPEAEATLLELLGIGLGFETAAPCIGWSVEGLRKWRRDDEEFEMRCQAAIGNGKRRVVGKLLELIDQGNDRAIIFWLKTRTEEFREEKIKVDGADPLAMASLLVAQIQGARFATPLGATETVPISTNGNGQTNGNGHH